MIFVEDLGAGDVGGHQVGRELDALEAQIEDLRQRLDQQRLGQPGHAGDQAMAAAEQRHQHFIDDVVLPDDDLAQFVKDLFAAARRPCPRGPPFDFHIRVHEGPLVGQRINHFVDQHLVRQRRPLDVARVFLRRWTTPRRRPCRCSS